MNRHRSVRSALALLAFSALLSPPAFAADLPATCFPASIEGFETAAFPPDLVAQLAAHRHTQATGYNAARYHTTVTVFVYDRAPGANDRKEAEAAIAEAMAMHEGAELAMGGEGKVPLAGVATPAIGGLLLWTEGGDDVGSFLWVVPRGDRYVKFRASYVRPRHDDELVAAMQFAMASLNTVASAVCDPAAASPTRDESPSE